LTQAVGNTVSAVANLQVFLVANYSFQLFELN